MEKNTSLLSALREVKEAQGIITQEDCLSISKDLRINVSQVCSVASFYSAFSGGDDGVIDPVAAVTRYAGPVLSKQEKSYEIYRELRKKNSCADDILAKINEMNLLGRSGSGFSVGVKWGLTKDAEGDEKYIICNGSEGEGRTYKDLRLLMDVPEKVIEGMLICSLAVGAKHGWLYVRSEYEEAAERVEKVLQEARKEGVLGKDFDIELFRGAGAYVCGEETALIRSIQGYRGEPQLKPPFPSIKGLFGKPTVINNTESFAFVSEAFRDRKENTKLYTITGCVERPGVYELPAGVTIAELAELVGCRGAKGAQLGGGTTGAILGKDAFNIPLNFENCRQKGLSLGTASVRFIGEEESVISVVLESIRFLAEQSCGKCTPCRFGLKELTGLLEQMADGCGNKETPRAALELAEYIGESSRCAFGTAAPTTLLTAMKAFPSEFEPEAGGTVR